MNKFGTISVSLSWTCDTAHLDQARYMLGNVVYRPAFRGIHALILTADKSEIAVLFIVDPDGGDRRLAFEQTFSAAMLRHAEPSVIASMILEMIRDKKRGRLSHSAASPSPFNL